MEITIPPFIKIALYNAGKFFWNTSVESNYLQFGEIGEDVKRVWENKLSRCREEAEHKLNVYITNKILPSVFEIPIRQIICSLHRTFYRLLLWKAMYDPSDKISLMQEGQFYAPNFFTVDGEFDDVSLAKRFVCDPNYDLIDRFCLASAFCFGKESDMIWRELKVLYGPEITENINFDRYFHNHSILTWQRILMLEQELLLPIQDLLLERRCVEGFYLAFIRKYEHAAYYFWKKISDNEKRKILTDIFIEVMHGVTDYPKDKIIHFLLPEISEQTQKEIFFSSLTTRRFEISYILLLSHPEEDVQSKLIDLCKDLPSCIYCDLIQVLACKVLQFRFPSELKIFSRIWENRNLEDQFYLLKSNLECIQTLAKAKSFNNLSYFIRHLSNEEKSKCLLYNLYGAGTSVLDILIKQNEFDMFNKYLTHFLTEIDFKSQNDVLRRDAKVLLESFLVCDKFIDWYNKISLKKNHKQILCRIYSLKESIIVLDAICDKVSFDFPMGETP